MSQHPAIFKGNPDLGKIVPVALGSLPLLGRLNRTVIQISYTDHDPVLDKDASPSEHILSVMCRKALISGHIQLRPYIFLTAAELKSGALSDKQVLVQSSSAGAQFRMHNKEWYPERFQSVIDAIKGKFDVIQIGSRWDPPLEGVVDLRGKTTIRETAAFLANSIVFLGLVGFLMHLARAVDCRSVIVYGGRERPWQSGYTCNVNLTGNTPCSPCWRWSTCDYDRDCMKLVSPESVVEGIFAQALKYGAPLECESAFL